MTMFFRVQKCFIAFSVAILFVVNWPNHGPGVDVEQGASSARGSLTVAHAKWIARFLAAVHLPGNGAVISSWNQRQFPQDVREWNDIQYRIGLGEIQYFRAYLSSAQPPWFGVQRWAVIVQSLDEGAHAFLDATFICAHSHLEDEINTSIPALKVSSLDRPMNMKQLLVSAKVVLEQTVFKRFKQQVDQAYQDTSKE